MALARTSSATEIDLGALSTQLQLQRHAELLVDGDLRLSGVCAAAARS